MVGGWEEDCVRYSDPNQLDTMFMRCEVADVPPTVQHALLNTDKVAPAISQTRCVRRFLSSLACVDTAGHHNPSEGTVPNEALTSLSSSILCFSARHEGPTFLWVRNYIPRILSMCKDICPSRLDDIAHSEN